MAKPRALSLFAGIGGLCEGVKLAGFEVVAAVELDKYACKSYRNNFPDIPLYEGSVIDFLDSSQDDYEKYVDILNDDDGVDLLFGGPPCQGYSQIGPRDIRDPRNELYMQMVRLADFLKPGVVLMENVPNLLLMKKGMFRTRILQAFSEIGYTNAAVLKLSADDYGVPQSRKRVFFIFTRSKTRYDLQSYAEALALSLVCDKKVSVDEAISDLPLTVAEDSATTLDYPSDAGGLSDFQNEMRLGCDGGLYSSASKDHFYKVSSGIGSYRLFGHHTKEIQEKRKKLLSFLKQGEKASSLPKEIWDNARPEKWRRFHPDLPAHTLMAQMHRDLSEWIHPHVDRWITVRESMRLQSFNDAFVLDSSEWQQLKQVGNAVPPLLGRIPALIAHSLLEDSFPVPLPLPVDGVQLSLTA